MTALKTVRRSIEFTAVRPADCLIDQHVAHDDDQAIRFAQSLDEYFLLVLVVVLVLVQLSVQFCKPKDPPHGFRQLILDLHLRFFGSGDIWKKTLE